MVYELIEDREKLHRLYGILFFFLENETMVRMNIDRVRCDWPEL